MLFRSRCIEEYKRLEDDQQQSKGKALVAKEFQQGGFQPRPKRDLRIHELDARVGEVNVTFMEPMHKILDRIKKGVVLPVAKQDEG